MTVQTTDSSLKPAGLSSASGDPKISALWPFAGTFIFPSKLPLLLVLLGFLELIPSAVFSQEALKMSLASAEAAEARRKNSTTVGYYNLQLGQTYWRFSGALGAEYDSNVTLRQNQAQSDYILRPEIDINLLVPVSDQNSLNVAVGAGYSAYVMHSELRRYYITPNTEMSFDVYVGDFWINLHDRISVSENSYQDPTVAGDGGYSQLQNAAGVAVVWDLNKLVLHGGYDHVDYSTLSGGGGRPDGVSELVSASAGCVLKPGLELGVELGGGILNYGNASTNSSFSNATEWNGGGYGDLQLTEYTHLRVSAGYTQYLPETKPLLGGGQNFSGVYTTLDLNHRLNQYVNYTLSLGHNISFALAGGTVDMYFAEWKANWHIFKKTSLSTAFDYEHGSQISTSPETFDRYGPAINLGRSLTEKLDATLGCQMYWRNSNLPGRDYSTYVISSNLRYRF